MSDQVFPTKGNLLNTKKSLVLAKLGYDLLDRKRNILIREMMTMIDTAKSIRGEIENTYKKAYSALQSAHITLGLCDDVANTIPIETGVSVVYRSVMGVEIPHVSIEQSSPSISYGFAQTNSQLDEAYIRFEKAKQLTVVLAEIDNSVYRLADAIKKTQKRANALKNIIIPRFDDTVKFITDALEEKEREEFSRLKVIKFAKENQTD
jgi:V/A-type H+-transporting ATPase subunit D